MSTCWWRYQLWLWSLLRRGIRGNRWICQMWQWSSPCCHRDCNSLSGSEKSKENCKAWFMTCNKTNEKVTEHEQKQFHYLSSCHHWWGTCVWRGQFVWRGRGRGWAADTELWSCPGLRSEWPVSGPGAGGHLRDHDSAHSQHHAHCHRLLMSSVCVCTDLMLIWLAVWPYPVNPDPVQSSAVVSMNVIMPMTHTVLPLLDYYFSAFFLMILHMYIAL